eukprot:gene16336-7726_t
MKHVAIVGLLLAVVGVSYALNAHDRILKANQDAREEELAFGFSEQPPLIEGDIVDDVATRQQIDAEAYGIASTFDAIAGRRKWENGVVPYVYGSVGSKAISAIEAAFRDYHAKTCLKFVKRTNQRDYIIFNAKGGCYSHIGRQGGQQEVSIGRGCEYKATTIHEIMHAIGFYHEQSRRDRDNYITVNFNNIVKGMEYNFNKYRQGEASTLGEPYDKKSVMHYAKYAFSKQWGKLQTIVSKSNPSEELGNEVGFSSIDLRQINKYYSCNGGGGGGPNPPVTQAPQPGSCSDRSENCRWNLSKCNYKGYGQYWCRKSCGFC